MFCSRCGNEIKEGAKYCSNCGKSISNTENDKNSKKLNKKIILIVLGIIVVVAIIGTVIFISNRKNSNIKNSNVNQMTNTTQQSDIIKENTKYISTGYNVNEDIEMGLNHLYLVFNNTTFKLYFDANFGGDGYDMFIKGTYSQSENHIVFDFSNVKIGFNENEEEVTAEYKSIVDTWSNILNNGVNISDEGETLIAIDNKGKTITFKSNEQNNIETNKYQINQNTKYIATGIEDLYKQAGITEFYLVFNNDEVKLVSNINMGEDTYEVYIIGSYNQNENHIIFDFSDAKVGYNNGKLDETEDIINSFAELFKDGAIISNENKTLTVVETDEITLAFEDSGIQVAKEENIAKGENFEIDMNDKVQQDPEKEKNSKDLIKATIDAYAKITTHYNGYDLKYRYYTLYARSINGENVYVITYSAQIKDYGISTGLEYCRLVSLDSTNTKIEKKSDFCEWTSTAGSVESSPLLRIQYNQIWGN